MITLTLVNKRQNLWLTQRGNEVKRITATPPNRRKDNIKHMRNVLSSAWKIPVERIRFLGNKNVNGQWISEWSES